MFETFDPRAMGIGVRRAARTFAGFLVIVGAGALVGIWAINLWQVIAAPPPVPWQSYYDATPSAYRARVESCATKITLAGDEDWQRLPTCVDLPFREQVDAFIRASDFSLERLRREALPGAVR